MLQNDGTSLAGIASGSVTFVYCWDAMVHFEPKSSRPTSPRSARVLAPGGRGFIHHSNWTRGRGLDFRTQPNWRNFMSRELFGGHLRVNGLEILAQDVINWDQSKPWWKTLWGLRPSKRPVMESDCISMFRKPSATA